MNNSQAVLIPGGLRWRSLVPLEDRNGLCEVVYDLERNILVEVPELFQYYIAMALECGNPDENLLGWLAGEDLLTYDQEHPAFPEGMGSGGSSMSDLSELTPGLGCMVFVEDRVHCRLTDGLDQSALETLDCLLGPLHGVPRLTLHLDGEGGRLGFEELCRIVDATRVRAEDTGRQISYELRLDAESATPKMASFLARHPFRVRVRCDGPPQPQPVLRALGLLREHLGENLTVHSVLRGGRVIDLWRWAQELGIQQLHVTRLSPRTEQEESRAAQLRNFRNDLEVLCDDMLESLQTDSGRPLLYEPIARVVRRLAHDHRHDPRKKASALGSPCLGVVSHGKVFPVYPAAGPASVSETATAAEWNGEGRSPEEDGERHPCRSCTARRLCGRGLAADPALSGIERVDIWGRHCDFWRAEVEAGLLFYRRLQRTDSEYLLGMGASSTDAFLDPPDAAAGFFEWKTC